MVEKQRTRVHLIAGGYPPGQHAGHDMDYARLRILQMLGEDDSIHTTVGGDYTDIDKWLQPDVSLLITYVAGPFAGEQEDEILKDWIDALITEIIHLLKLYTHLIFTKFMQNTSLH